MSEIFYSVTLGKHTSITTTADDALAWIQARTLDSLPLSIARVTITDDGRSVDNVLLSYAGHRPAKHKPRNWRRGLRKANKRKRKQKHGGKA